MSRHAIIVGASGQIGRAAGTALAAEGWSVTAVHRGNAAIPAEWAGLGVRTIRADRDEPGGLRRVVAETGGADVVVDTVAYDDVHAAQWMELSGDVGSAVVVSSASVYADGDGHTLDEATGGDDFPRFDGAVDETQPTVPPGPDTYSTRKVRLERALLDDSRLAVTVLRPCAIHGPGSTSPREWWPLVRALDGRPAVPLAFGGESVFHTSSAVNLGELIRLAAAEPADRVLNAGDPQPPTVAEIVRLVSATVGHAPEIVTFDGPAGPDHAGTTPWSTPRPFVVDMTAAERTLGYRPLATYADAVGATSAWLRDQVGDRPWREAFPLLVEFYGDRMDDYAAEDALLARLRRG